MEKSDYIGRLKKAEEIYNQRITIATNNYNDRVELTNELYIAENSKFPIDSLIRIKNIPIYIKVSNITVQHFPYNDSVEIYYHGLRYKKTDKGFIRTKNNKESRFSESNSILIEEP